MQKNKKSNSSFIRYSGLALQMLTLIGGGTYGGILLDKHFQSEPLFTISLSLLSVLLSLGYVIKEFLKK